MPLHDWSKVPDAVFHALHVAWLGRLQDVLNTRLLPEPFYALTETVTGEAVPDVITLQAGDSLPSTGAPDRRRTIEGGTIHDDAAEGVIALAPSPALVQDLGPEPYGRLARRLVVRNEWEGDTVVAVLEPVSRSNKGSQAKAEIVVRKLVGFLERGIHVLVIDLHPPTALVPSGFHAQLCAAYGEVPLAAPPDRDRSAVSYQVLESGKVRSHVVPLRAGDNLPEMALFLLPHRFVRVPLEETYAEAFHGLPGKFRGELEG